MVLTHPLMFNGTITSIEGDDVVNVIAQVMVLNYLIRFVKIISAIELKIVVYSIYKILLMANLLVASALEY